MTRLDGFLQKQADGLRVDTGFATGLRAPQIDDQIAEVMA
jgi:hypothetical protein